MATGLLAGVESNFARVLVKERRAASWKAVHSWKVRIAIPYLSRPEAFSTAGSERFSTEAMVIDPLTTLDYPIVLFGDFEDRNPKVGKTIDISLELLGTVERSAAMGIKDIAPWSSPQGSTAALVGQVGRRQEEPSRMTMSLTIDSKNVELSTGGTVVLGNVVDRSGKSLDCDWPYVPTCRVRTRGPDETSRTK